MKEIIICAVLLVFETISFSQQTNPKQPLTRQDYLKKSKNQKMAAWVLLGGGTLLIGTGFLIGDRKESTFDDAATGAVIGGIGVLSAIGSIPLFIPSVNNRERGMAASAYLKMENAPLLQSRVITMHAYPAVNIKVKL